MENRIPIWLPTLLVFLMASSAFAGNAQDDFRVELARAEAAAKTAKNQYERLLKLAESGSASKRELRRAKLGSALSQLDVASLREPAQRKANDVKKASAILDYHESELAVVTELYQSGSATKLKFRRSQTARDIAQSNLNALKSPTVTQQKIHLIKAASAKYQLAKTEHEIAQRLYQSGSISAVAMDKANSKLKVALAEFESRKKSLGARAVQLKQ